MNGQHFFKTKNKNKQMSLNLFYLKQHKQPIVRFGKQDDIQHEIGNRSPRKGQIGI